MVARQRVGGTENGRKEEWQGGRAREKGREEGGRRAGEGAGRRKRMFYHTITYLFS